MPSPERWCNTVYRYAERNAVERSTGDGFYFYYDGMPDGDEAQFKSLSELAKQQTNSTTTVLICPIIKFIYGHHFSGRHFTS